MNSSKPTELLLWVRELESSSIPLSVDVTDGRCTGEAVGWLTLLWKDAVEHSRYVNVHWTHCLTLTHTHCSLIKPIYNMFLGCLHINKASGNFSKLITTKNKMNKNNNVRSDYGPFRVQKSASTNGTMKGGAVWNDWLTKCNWCKLVKCRLSIP